MTHVTYLVVLIESESSFELRNIFSSSSGFMILKTFMLKSENGFQHLISFVLATIMKIRPVFPCEQIYMTLGYSCFLQKYSGILAGDSEVQEPLERRTE